MSKTIKKYAAGMYGGKFMPMHRGHLRCIEMASELCEHVYLIMFIGGTDEAAIHEKDGREFLSVEKRWEQTQRAAAMFIQHFDAVYLTKKSIYLIMAVVGLVNWCRLQKRNEANA